MLNLFRLKIFWKFFTLFLFLIFLFFFFTSILFNHHWIAVLVFGFLFSILISLILAHDFNQFYTPFLLAIQSMRQKKWQVRVPVLGDDELTVLSRSMNQFSESLVDFIEQMSKESKQLRVILDSMIEGVMVLNEDGEIILTNSALIEMFSLENSPIGFTSLEAIRNLHLQELIREASFQKKSLEREIEIRSNTLRQIRIYATPLKENEKIKGSVLVFHDITSLRNLENLRKDFVANVSHELKTPLTAIKGYTETLIGGALRDEKNANKFLEIIHEHTNRLTHLLTDLLDLSKIESGQYSLRYENFSLQSLINELISTFSHEIKSKEIIFKFIPKNVDSIFADRIALRQILSNLLENAIKYSNQKSTIILQAESNTQSIRFEIEDNGPGISPEHLPRIFERFYRTDASRSRELGGTGLGLSIVKHLIQLHGGEISVESKLDKGSKFIFTIPRT